MINVVKKLGGGVRCEAAGRDAQGGGGVRLWKRDQGCRLSRVGVSMSVKFFI